MNAQSVHAANEIGPPAPRPCDSCPYRRDVPSGVWAASEYDKLRAYDCDTDHLRRCNDEEAPQLAWIELGRFCLSIGGSVRS